MANIELTDLTKDYRQGKNTVRALDGVSLRIEAGEFVSIVGRSGSGKTTLLDMLGMLLRPTSGTLKIDGVDTASLGDTGRAAGRARQIGFIFQEYNLLPALNVLQNVMLPLRYAKAGVKDGRRRALDLLELVGLADHAHRRPGELAGGQQQRVAIARALINGPTIVLGDEPTGAVDTQTSEELLAVMRRLNREQVVTFVIVTHDLELAAQTDRMIRLKDGRVIGDHTVDRESVASAFGRLIN
jgi:putative ABC transport system ATP-binding protein